MPLDPMLKVILDALAALDSPSFEHQTPDEARAAYRAGRAGMTGEPVARVEALSLAGPAGAIPARLYAPGVAGPLPATVYFHGGGWVIGDLDTHDGFCRAIANRAQCAVIAVDYRLAPEHKYPAAADDAYAALVAVHERAAELGLDPARIALLGDSAGGELVAVTARRARDRGGPRLVMQAMINPVTNFSFDTQSYRDNATGYFLTADMMRWFWALYLPSEADGASPDASPLRASDLSGLPPAFMLTAEFDPLRDEGDAYAEALAAAGVDVIHRRYDGMTHEFIHMGQFVPRALEAIDETAAVLRDAFARG